MKLSYELVPWDKSLLPRNPKTRIRIKVKPQRIMSTASLNSGQHVFIQSSDYVEIVAPAGLVLVRKQEKHKK